MRDLNLYIRTDKSFEQFVSDFNKLFSLNLSVQNEDNQFTCNYCCLDIEFLLYDNHNMEDDLGIEYSKYNICLSLIKLNRGGVLKEYYDLYESVAKYYAVKIFSELKLECILVEDCQNILLQL